MVAAVASSVKASYVLLLLVAEEINSKTMKVAGVPRPQRGISAERVAGLALF